MRAQWECVEAGGCNCKRIHTVLGGRVRFSFRIGELILNSSIELSSRVLSSRRSVFIGKLRPHLGPRRLNNGACVRSSEAFQSSRTRKSPYIKWRERLGLGAVRARSAPTIL